MKLELDIVPMEKLSEELIDALKYDLKDKNFIVRVYAKTDPPKTSLNVYRKQYNADIILDTLRSLKGTIIAIADFDLYNDKLNYIFSAAEYDGPALISIYRLNPEFYKEPANFDKLIDRLVKEIIYCVGRIKGLKDCPNPRCIMHQANSARDLDFKNKDFCSECKINNTVKGIEF